MLLAKTAPKIPKIAATCNDYLIVKSSILKKILKITIKIVQILIKDFSNSISITLNNINIYSFDNKLLHLND